MQLLERRADHGLARLARIVAPGHLRVLLLGAQEVDVLHGDQPHGGPDRRAHPAQRLRGGVGIQRLRELLQQRLRCRAPAVAARSRSCNRDTVSARRAGSTGFTR